MSYSAHETSLELGSPIELFEFTQKNKRWFYASCVQDVVFSGQTYTASPIRTSNIKSTPNVFKDGVTLTFPRDNTFANQFIGYPPEDITTITIWRGHYNDAANEYIVYWKGRLVGVKSTGNEIMVECESIFTSIKQPGLRARFEYSCRHVLYGPGCRANREAFKHIGTVQSISGAVNISVSGASLQPNGYYTGGILVAPDDTSRFITGHTGDVVTISRALTTLAGAMSVTIYPGCDHIKETCHNKFNNLDNFGGFPFIPTRNPFDGSSII